MNEKCLSSECEKFMDGMNFTAEEFELSALLNQLMQGVSVSTLAAWASGGSCRTVSLFRDYLKLLNRSGINPMVDGSCFGRQCMLRLYSINTSSARRLESRIKAAWLFSGGGKEMDASIERSEAANEEIVIFFFQLDLETRIQYALNTEQYDVAQQLRNKLNEVGTEIIKQQEAKRGSSRNDAQDKALNLLRLQ